MKNTTGFDTEFNPEFNTEFNRGGVAQEKSLLYIFCY